MFFRKNNDIEEKTEKLIDEEKKLLKLCREVLNDTHKMLTSKEFLCACYLYKFIEVNDIAFYQKFIDTFSKFTINEKNKTFEYYHSLVANFEKEENKQKIRKLRGND